MRKSKRDTAGAESKTHWMACKSYGELRDIMEARGGDIPAAENWAIMERMRQLRYGYKPGELKMDRTTFRLYTMEEFRAATEREYE